MNKLWPTWCTGKLKAFPPNPEPDKCSFSLGLLTVALQVVVLFVCMGIKPRALCVVNKDNLTKVNSSHLPNVSCLNVSSLRGHGTCDRTETPASADCWLSFPTVLRQRWWQTTYKYRHRQGSYEKHFSGQGLLVGPGRREVRGASNLGCPTHLVLTDARSVHPSVSSTVVESPDWISREYFPIWDYLIMFASVA